MRRESFATRKSTSISIDAELLAEVRRFGINMSRTCERALKTEVAQRRREQWLEENAAAIASSNAYVEKHGLPLADSILF